jgi:hypothetical protein
VLNIAPQTAVYFILTTEKSHGNERKLQISEINLNGENYESASRSTLRQHALRGVLTDD